MSSAALYDPAISRSPRFSRTDRSIIGRWWLTLDHPLLFAFGFMIFMGAVVSLAAAPAVAERLNTSRDFLLAQRQLLLLPVATIAMLAVSMFPTRLLRRLCILAFPFALLLLLLVPFLGVEIKGGTRWINIGSFSLQPTEFIKPLLAVLSGWLLSIHLRQPAFPGRRISALPFLLVALLVATQPDLGQTVVITAVWACQLFLSGLPLFWILALGGAAVGGLLLAYSTLDHVHSRVNAFLDPTSSADRYQIEKSLDSFRDGGWFGKGPGEGSIKVQLPDAHADFVFAVIGEEFGILVCALILLVVAFIVVRGLLAALRSRSAFASLTLAGLIVQFGGQSVINMCTALNLIPTKGMTLPFLSYGGSSLLATGAAMGMVLALTRRDADLSGAFEPEPQDLADLPGQTPLGHRQHPGWNPVPQPGEAAQ